MKHDIAWYWLSRRLAWVAAVFSLIVLGVLVAHHWRSVTVAGVIDGQVAALRAQLARRPKDEGLKMEIRRVDLRVRETFFRQRAFVRLGGMLLLGGVAVLLLAVKCAKQYRVKLPCPVGALPAERDIAARGRYAVLLVGVLLGGLLLGFAYSAHLESDVAVAAPNAPADYPSTAEVAKHWPRFRGPDGNAIVTGAYPTAWNGAKGVNIVWKTKVPLPGENSPVVWGDRLFLAGANEHLREVYCYDTTTGKLLWKQSVTDLSCADAGPLNVMADTGYAAPTLTTDGTHAVAMFANGDLACFDYTGKRLWAKNMGKPQNMYGHATSLLLYRDRLLLQFDQGDMGEDGTSALLALNVATGMSVWTVKRNVPNSWSTPIVINTGKREELITCANPWVIAYDPATGKELWRVECLGGDVAPSPVFAGGLIFVANTGANLAAIRPGGAGDVTKTHVAWMAMDDLPDIVSPVSNGSLVLTVVTYGVLTCYDAKTGKKAWTHSYDNLMFRSSPTVVGDRIYLLDEKGVMHIIAAGRAFKELGTAALGEQSNCSPAFVNGRIYVRGKYNLYCIGAKL